MCHPEVPAGTVAPKVEAREVSIRVEDGQMPALLALPARVPAPAVLIVNDVYGRSAFYEDLARRIAQAGFVALDPEYFWREGAVPASDREASQARAQKLDQPRTLRDLDAALAWLRSSEYARGRVSTMGFCMGGTLVLDMAASAAADATVCYYGFPARGGTPPAPPRPLDLAGRMRGPILGFWGDQDTGVGMENVTELDERLRAAKVQHEFHVYPGLGHGFLKAYLEDERSPGYAQACESWTRTIAFWRERLA